MADPAVAIRLIKSKVISLMLKRTCLVTQERDRKAEGSASH